MLKNMKIIDLLNDISRGLFLNKKYLSMYKDVPDCERGLFISQVIFSLLFF